MVLLVNGGVTVAQPTWNLVCLAHEFGVVDKMLLALSAAQRCSTDTHVAKPQDCDHASGAVLAHGAHAWRRRFEFCWFFFTFIRVYRMELSDWY